MVCILKEMQTVIIIYKLSVTNLEFTLGLTENTDVNGKKINDFFSYVTTSGGYIRRKE